MHSQASSPSGLPASSPPTSPAEPPSRTTCEQSESALRGLRRWQRHARPPWSQPPSGRNETPRGLNRPSTTERPVSTWRTKWALATLLCATLWLTSCARTVVVEDQRPRPVKPVRAGPRATAEQLEAWAIQAVHGDNMAVLRLVIEIQTAWDYEDALIMAGEFQTASVAEEGSQ